MSRSYLMAAGDDGHLKARVEYANAWGNHPMIWDALATRYMKEFGGTGMPFMDWEKLITWVTSGNADVLAPWEFNVLSLSYDGAYVEGAEDIELYAKSLDKFFAVYSQADRICHLKKIADHVRELAAQGFTHIAWHGTSVNTNPWQVTIAGEEDPRGFNFKTDLDRELRSGPYRAARAVMKPLGDAGVPA
jgi:hypothetical protein